MNNKNDVSKSMYEGGRYFMEGLDWYKDSYLSSKLSRNSYFIIFLIVFFSILVSVFVIRNFYPMKQKSTIILRGENEMSQKYVFVKLDKYSHPTLSVAKAMISEYIVEREGYKYGGISSIGEIQDKLSKIEFMSHKDVFSEYRKSDNSFDDFMYLFQNKIDKDVTVDSVEYESGYTFFDSLMYMIMPGKIPSSAIVKISQTIKGITTKYIVKVDFFIKIPAIPTNDESDSVEVKDGGDLMENNEKISDIKAYLTGLSKTFDPRIQFLILNYSKQKTI